MSIRQAQDKQKIVPHLWFDRQAEEAAKFYTSIFKNSKIGKVSRYGKEGFEVHRMPEGTAMTVEFTFEGQNFLALNAGPVFKFNEAISFLVNCETQEEVDYLWKKLSAVPESEQCGWLKDKYGLSWQIIPKQLGEMLGDPDPAKAGRTFSKEHHFPIPTNFSMPALKPKHPGQLISMKMTLSTNQPSTISFARLYYKMLAAKNKQGEYLANNGKRN